MAENPARLWTVSELVKEVPDMPADMSTQRMTPLLTTLVNEGYVAKTKEKGKSLYQWVAPSEDESEE